MLRQFFQKKSKGRSPRTYLDWASAAPVHPVAARAFQDALRVFGNPSSPHEEGRQAKELLEGARTRIARLAGVKSAAVIFTSGATEANNLSIRGHTERLQANGVSYSSMHVLYLPTMHASAIGSIEELAKLGVKTEAIALSGFCIDMTRFEMQLRKDTVLVCTDAVCGETGVRFDVLRMRRSIDAERAEGRAKDALLHVDASQLPLVEPIEHTRLGADMLVLDAQKVGGVRGIGALVILDARSISPILQGGGQEGGLRPGTEPVALAAAFAAALAVRAAGYEKFAERAREARAQLIAHLNSSIPQTIVNEGARQAPHILNISLPGYDTDYAVTLLDTAGFAVSTKSACETDAEAGSKAVLVCTGDTTRAASTLRVSWGPESKPSELRRLVAEVTRITNFLAAV